MLSFLASSFDLSNSESNTVIVSCLKSKSSLVDLLIGCLATGEENKSFLGDSLGTCARQRARCPLTGLTSYVLFAMRSIMITSLERSLWQRRNSFSHFLFLKIHRGFPDLSLGISVSTGLESPSTFSVIGLPIPAFLDGPPKTSGGKKSLPHGRMFRLPYL